MIKRNDEITKMIRADIDRCVEYLSHPPKESDVNDLLYKVTNSYISIIPNLDAWKKQYNPLVRWDNPMNKSSLVSNLRTVMLKLVKFYNENCTGHGLKIHVVEKKAMSNKIFIVHGHDDEAKQEMARTLEKGGFIPIILHEQADSGRTIIEKFEDYADVDFAVVLYTECDLGRAKKEDQKNEKYRARQNVVFEHGYLMGKLGRDHVCALVKGNVETPGDIDGVVYVKMDSAGGWKIKLGQNMEAVGLSVDLNKFCGLS